LRLRQALTDGVIDAMMMDASDSDLAHYALPLTSAGKLDAKRAIPMYTVVFVRAEDQVPLDSDPNSYFTSRRLGMNNGATLAEQMRKQGVSVDDGAKDGASNLEKLIRGRIDGYAATLVTPMQMDAYINGTFGAKLVRLAAPLRVHHFWLGFNKRYYDRNRPQVEAMWEQLGMQGQAHFTDLVEQYQRSFSE
jgi:hypothetical protein